MPESLPPETVTRWIGRLPPFRQPTLARRLANGRGLASLTGLALLASLSSACGLPPLGNLQWTRRGKPDFPHGPNFSITHSGGHAACAAALDGSVIGIDMETVERARFETVRLVASEDEREALSDGSVTPVELWTAKEAVVKAAGEGMPEIHRVRLLRDRARFAGVDYFIRNHALGDGLVMAIATLRSISALRIHWPSLGELFG